MQKKFRFQFLIFFFSHFYEFFSAKRVNKLNMKYNKCKYSVIQNLLYSFLMKLLADWGWLSFWERKKMLGAFLAFLKSLCAEFWYSLSSHTYLMLQILWILFWDQILHKFSQISGKSLKILSLKRAFSRKMQFQVQNLTCRSRL